MQAKNVWVPILVWDPVWVAKGPYLVLISSKFGSLLGPYFYARRSLLVLPTVHCTYLKHTTGITCKFCILTNFMILVNLMRLVIVEELVILVILVLLVILFILMNLGFWWI